MSAEHDSRVRDAFGRLRNDAHEVDTMAALRNIRRDDRPTWLVPALAGAAAAVILVIAGFVFLSEGDDGDVFAGDPSTTTDGTDVSDEDDGPFDPAGTSWILTSGTGPDGPIPIVAGWPITLEFDDGVVGGTAACNDYGSNYTSTETTISIAPPDHNDAGCDGNVMASQTSFLAALPAVEMIEKQGPNLVLTGPDVELVFEPAVPVPTEELVGQLWLLDGLVDGEATTEPSGDPATLLLSEDGTLEGSTGCRGFSGEFIVTGTAVQFTSWGMDATECPLQLSDQDNHVVSVLGDGFSARVEGDRLILTSAGDEGLTYLAIDEMPDGPSTGDTIGIDELLDTRPDGEVTVSGHLINSGGGWYLCPNLATDIFTRCAGRWVTVTNVGEDLLTPLGPTTDSTEFGDVTYTEDPISVTGSLLDDGRFALAGTDSGTELSDADTELLNAFTVLDPNSPDPTALRLSADGVLLSLADSLAVERAAEELADPAAWQLDLEAFRGRVGPFSALGLLGSADKVLFMAGPHDHCASPPAPVPEELRDLRQLSIQPAGIDSCIAWWTVDIFVDADGEVVGITLDTWEP